MKRLHTFIIFLLAWGFIVPVLSHASPTPAYRRDIRAMGMGNAYTALSRGSSALFYNPAGLGRSRFGLEIAGMKIAVNRRIENVLTFVQNNQDNFNDFQTLTPEQSNQFLSDMDSFDDQYVGFGLNPEISLTMFHFGLASYVDFRPDLRLDKGIYVPRIYLKGYLDWVTAFGYGRSFDVPGLDNFQAGIAFKYIQRREIKEMKVGAGDISEMNTLGNTLLDTLKTPMTGFATDVGFMFTPVNNMDVGVAIQNLGSLDGESFPMSVNIGTAYNVANLSNLPIISSVLLTGDIRDAFNSTGVNYFNHLSLGAEFKIPVISLRAGINQGYVTTGFGVNFFLLHLDYAYFGRELGTAPGFKPDFNHVLELKIGI